MRRAVFLPKWDWADVVRLGVAVLTFACHLAAKRHVLHGHGAPTLSAIWIRRLYVVRSVSAMVLVGSSLVSLSRYFEPGEVAAFLLRLAANSLRFFQELGSMRSFQA